MRTGLTVEVAGTIRVDAKLEVGATSESVTVTEAAPCSRPKAAKSAKHRHQHAGRSSRSSPSPVLRRVSARPTRWAISAIRCPQSQLLPGARITTDSVMRINGMPSNSQSINIEGQDATNGFFKQQNQINQAGMDAIQEVAIQTSNFAAEYGQAGGGYFNYTMKSGTNQLHGSAYDYFVNEALNAGMPFTDAGTTNPNKDGQHIRNPHAAERLRLHVGRPDRDSRKSTTATTRRFSFSTSSSSARPPSPATQSGSCPRRRSATAISARPSSTNRATAGSATVSRILSQLRSSIPTTQTTVNGKQVRDAFPNNTIPAQPLRSHGGRSSRT